MKILVIGAGKVGRYLLNDLLEKGHKITLIEQDKEKCNNISDKYDIKVICGDGSEKKTLEKAGVEDAELVLAVTQDDQDNLVICQLAERQYNVPQTFTRVNTPGNEKLFDWLGVNVAISSASLLSALVDQELAIKDLKDFLNKDQDKLKLLRIPVSDKSKVINKKVKKIDLPLESILVTILRGNKPIVPRGNTRVLAGDIILALTKPELKGELNNIFN